MGKAFHAPASTPRRHESPEDATGALEGQDPGAVRARGPALLSNLALDLRLFGLAEAVDSQWAAQVTRSTVARIRARIPPIPGLP